MAFGITGQSSRSSTSQADSNNSDSYNTSDSNNTQYNLQGGEVFSGDGPVTINSVDGGLVDTASKIVESALGLVSRVVETGFGSANRAADLVASTSSNAVDQVAAANDRPLAGSLKRYGVWLAGGALLLGLVWILLRKGSK